MKKYLLPLVIALSALSVSASAAFYSVTGLSMLFAGASFAVIIMASSLEVSKLVIASLLYQYWDSLNKILRTYLTIAAAILILITSAGIYGFLSAAYQETATQSEIVDKQIAALESKKVLYEETRDNLLADRKSNNELRGTLSKGSTTQYTDKNGNLVVRTNNSAIKNIESTSKENEKLAAKLDIVNDSIFSLETQILNVKVNSEATSELGPLKYISNLTGQPMDKIINWFLLVIIFVFDPLAIALVVAANFAFAQIRPKKESSLEEDVEGMKKVVEAYDDLQDEIKEWDSTLMDGLEDDYYDNLEWDEYGNPSPVIKEEPKKDQPIPVFVDPKTGKLYYEEPDPEPANLDLNNDEIIEEEELQQVFEQTDTNNDGIIDEEEAKVTNLSEEQVKELNDLKQSLDILETINQNNNYDFQWKKDTIAEEIRKIKEKLLKNFNKDDDNTITYF